MDEILTPVDKCSWVEMYIKACVVHFITLPATKEGIGGIPKRDYTYCSEYTRCCGG